jgi:hypothetical protein
MPPRATKKEEAKVVSPKAASRRKSNTKSVDKPKKTDKSVDKGKSVDKTKKADKTVDKTVDKSVDLKKVKESKKPKDLGPEPKRNKSAYTCFTTEYMLKHKDEHPTMGVAAKAWGELSAEQQKPYIKMADEDL